MTTTNTGSEESPSSEARRVFRFDIFKGRTDSDGRVRKLRSAGAAYHADGTQTYHVHLKALQKDQFFLLPERKLAGVDFVILTRGPADNPNKKYFWNTIGEGKILSGNNAGLMRLKWDLFSAEDIYMNLYPQPITSQRELQHLSD